MEKCYQKKYLVLEASDIGVAIKRAGGAFKAAGGEVEELIALFTSVRATTRETAETIATGFRTIFTRLQRPTTIKFLREFGIELDPNDPWTRQVLERIKALEYQGYQFEGAEASLLLLMHEARGSRQRYFSFEKATVTTEMGVDEKTSVSKVPEHKYSLLSDCRRVLDN